MTFTSGDEILAITIPFLAICTLALGLRLYTRIGLLKAPGWDDAFITLSWVLTVGDYIILAYAIRYDGLGEHFYDLPLSKQTRLPNLLKSFWVAVFFYHCALACAKFSMFLCFLRIFHTGKVRWASFAGITLTAANLLWAFLTNLFFCNPIRKFWDVWTPGKCLSTDAVWFANSSFSIATSCIILLVPLPSVVRMKLELRAKIMLLWIFGLGIFDIIVSVLRFVSLNNLSQSIKLFHPDSTHGLRGLSIWSLLELTVAILCASMQVLKPLIVKYFPNVLSITQASNATRTATHFTTWKTEGTFAAKFKGLLTRKKPLHAEPSDDGTLALDFWAKSSEDAEIGKVSATTLVEEESHVREEISRYLGCPERTLWVGRPRSRHDLFT